MGFHRRLKVLFALVALALLGIWVRVFELQVISAQTWKEEAEKLRRRSYQVGGPRGRILDADGKPMAVDTSIVQLVFHPGEWASRERFRCRACGTVAFVRSPRWSDHPERPSVPPRSCSCGARRDAFEPLPEQDLAPLEEELHLPPGTLAAAADDRMAALLERVEVWVADTALGLAGETAVENVAKHRGVAPSLVLEELAGALEEHEFAVEDLRKYKRTDLYSRMTPFKSFRLPSGLEVPVRRLEADAERLLELDKDGRYRGFRAEPSTERTYPNRSLVAQLLGYTQAFHSRDELRRFQEEFGADAVLPDDRVGRCGLEGWYDDRLRGSPGRIVNERDEDGDFTVRRVVSPPVRGDDVRLHLTAEACERATAELRSVATDQGFMPGGPASGGFVMMDAETGAILAWAEAPTYDPNESLRDVSTALDDEDAAEESARREGLGEAVAFVTTVRPALAYSRVAKLAVEPGSCLKLVTGITLLESGHPLAEDYWCAGRRRRSLNDYPRCSHDHPNPVALESAEEHSCNRFFADMSSTSEHFAQHRELFQTWRRRLGIGEPPASDLAASRGLYPAALDRGRIRQVSIGQGMTATPLQMVRVAALLQNGHLLPLPRLAASVGEVPVKGGGVEVALDPGTLRRMRTGMRAVVRTGTAKGRFDGLPGLEDVAVYGKTGTAEVTGRKDWGVVTAVGEPGVIDPEEPVKPWHLWFVGYAEKPGHRPVAFAMVLHARDRGGGGDAAAPAVARFLSWWWSR